jgi:methionine-gamma-lyase
MMNKDYGFGGILTLDMETADNAGKLMTSMQDDGVGYLAVSLGYFKTLFSNSGTSTSSEVPIETQKEMGLSPGLIRMSIGLDQDIELTWKKIENCLNKI